MKRLFILLLLVFALAGCYQDEESDKLITVTYSGEYYIFILNNTHLYVIGKTGNSEITKEKVESVTGKLGAMDIRVNKVLGPAYPDKGQLILALWNDDDLLDTDIALLGDGEAQIIYNF